MEAEERLEVTTRIQMRNDKAQPVSIARTEQLWQKLEGGTQFCFVHCVYLPWSGELSSHSFVLSFDVQFKKKILLILFISVLYSLCNV